MNPVKVILSNGEGDELDLGTFNQGVVFECLTEIGAILVEDVASSEPIAIVEPGRGARPSRLLSDGPFYPRMFVQAAEDQHLRQYIADMDRICKRGES